MSWVREAKRETCYRGCFPIMLIQKITKQRVLPVPTKSSTISPVTGIGYLPNLSTDAFPHTSAFNSTCFCHGNEKHVSPESMLSNSANCSGNSAGNASSLSSALNASVCDQTPPNPTKYIQLVGQYSLGKPITRVLSSNNERCLSPEIPSRRARSAISFNNGCPLLTYCDPVESVTRTTFYRKRPYICYGLTPITDQ